MSAAVLLAAAMAVGAPVAIDDALLAGLSTESANFASHGKTQICEGPLLRDVVARMGAPTGEAVRGPALAQGILVSARDGYRVVFSLGELDGTLGASGAILATRCDGKRLSESDGPYRLVVWGELRAARSVRQIATMTLVSFEPKGQ